MKSLSKTYLSDKKNVPCFEQIFEHVLEFEAREDEPNLTMPPPDYTLGDLERQGLAREVTDNTWNYKLDSPWTLEIKLCAHCLKSVFL